nr:hypothetical protein Hi04_10k_c4321_00002 [uncultured bacterium]
MPEVGSASNNITMNVLSLKLPGGVTLAVPASLTSTTTYVLLEQERWFEKETDFLRQWIRPGMAVIDIGANLGVYSLPIARWVGRTGRVFAYEPGNEARTLLGRSRELNAAFNLEILPFAMSDREREGRLVFGASSELNALGEGGVGEPVHIVSLDSENANHRWPPPDFVKIDAEGEEERILAGGRHFFEQYSPLVMFEIKAGRNVNERLRVLFPALGYRLFRQLVGQPILVPDNADQPLDGYELNLFAAKPDRMVALARQGYLVDSIPPWKASADDYKSARSFWQSQPFASWFGVAYESSSAVDPDYHDCLAAYAVWRAAAPPVATRVAALSFAMQGSRIAAARAPTVERLSTLARIAWEWGARSECVAVLRRLLETLNAAKTFQISEPFWPAHPRFDSMTKSVGEAGHLFVGASAEQFEQSGGYSSLFTGASPVLAWLCQLSFSAAEMERRRVLLAARSGQQPEVPLRLCTVTLDHLNADLWRSGQVPGTVVKA